MEPAAPGPNFRVDGWIDPPLYTRLPPLLIAMDGSDQHLRAPVNAQLIVRIAGQGKAASETTLTPNAGLVPVPGQEARPDLRERAVRLDVARIDRPPAVQSLAASRTRTSRGR